VAAKRRNWFRFSLRTLLIVAPLAAVVLGIGIRAWYASYLEWVAIEEIENLGGLVTRNEAGEVVGVELPGTGIDDEKLRQLVPHLMNLRRLDTLILINSGVTDEGLMLLARLPNLQMLYLADTLATDQGIAKLRGLRPKLQIDRSNPHIKAARLARRPVFEHAILTLALAPGGQQILAGSGDGRLQVFDLTGDDMPESLRAHDEWTFTVVVHPDGQRVATGGGDGLVKLWWWPDLEEAARFEGHNDDIHAIAFTPDGQTLVSTGDDMTVRIWDVASQEERLCLEGHTGTIPGLAISPDGQIAASASRDDTIRLWNTVSGECVGILEGHTSDVMSVDFHPNGNELVSASYDRTLIAWDLDTHQPIRKYEGHADWAFAVRYSPDGAKIASAGGDGVRLWSRNSGRVVWHSPATKNASHVLWLNSAELAASSATGSINLFDATRGDSIATLWTRFAPGMAEGN
jgi:WD40 repeat protein